MEQDKDPFVIYYEQTVWRQKPWIVRAVILLTLSIRCEVIEPTDSLWEKALLWGVCLALMPYAMWKFRKEFNEPPEYVFHRRNRS